MNPEKITLKTDVGTAKAGSVFIRGDLSHGVPEAHKGAGRDDETWWYWKEGSKREDPNWLPFSCMDEQV